MLLAGKAEPKKDASHQELACEKVDDFVKSLFVFKLNADPSTIIRMLIAHWVVWGTILK